MKTRDWKLPAAIAFVLAFAGLTNAQVTKEEQSALTPDKVLTDLMAGNAVLSCLDSRVPVELVFDQRIGHIFVGRVAGNIEDEDRLGSMEFATKLAGAKLVFVLGHSACGAVKGACDGATLGNLTALPARIGIAFSGEICEICG